MLRKLFKILTDSSNSQYLDNNQYLRNATVEQKRELMLKALAKGKIASITYTDAKGVVQNRQAKLWIERHLTSGNRNIVGVNVPASRDARIFPYSDITKSLGKDEFKSLRLDRLHKIVSGGVVYEFV